MLSEEKQETLKERVLAWGKAENVPDNILERVFQFGVQNPISEDDMRTICDTELWSYTTMDWYMKFVKYLEDTKSVEAPDDVTEEATVIRDAVVALQKALAVLEARSGQ